MELTLIWLIIGGALIGASVVVMAAFKKEGSWPMVLLFMGLAFVILYLEPLEPPANLALLFVLAILNAIWLGVLAHKVIPRFSVLVGMLGGVMTLLLAFLISF